MQSKVEMLGDIAVVEILGEHLDAANAKDFKAHVAPLVEQHSRMIFDLVHLRFVDSSGLGAILSCLRRLNDKGGDLKLCGMTKQVRVLFELVRMHRIFEIFNSREEAARGFQDRENDSTN
jgi:anti-sigma B factor antagonist